MDVLDPWLAVAALAAQQWGRVSTAQLHAAGIGRGAIEKAVRSGRLHRLHRGVYAVGHLAPSVHGRWMAAVLACGDEAALSHRSAARLHRIVRAEGPRPDVTVPGDRRPSGITVHRAPLPMHHVTGSAASR
jgi:predicted transcriptional regulator of viral defense system